MFGRLDQRAPETGEWAEGDRVEDAETFICGGHGGGGHRDNKDWGYRCIGSGYLNCILFVLWRLGF